MKILRIDAAKAGGFELGLLVLQLLLLHLFLLEVFCFRQAIKVVIQTMLFNGLDIPQGTHFRRRLEF